MALPTQFPAWLVLPDGRDVLVLDQAGVRAVVAQGGTYALTTPSQILRTTGSQVTSGANLPVVATGATISEASLNDEQGDPRPVSTRGRNRTG